MPDESNTNATRIQNAVKKVTDTARLVRTEEAIFMVPHDGSSALRLNSAAARRKVAELTGCGPNGKLMDALIDKLSGLGFSTARRATVAMFMYRPLAPEGGQALLVHTGAGVVWRSTGSGWSPVPNGHDGVLFVEEDGFEPIGVDELTEAGRRVIPGSFPTLDAVLLNELPPPEGSLTREEQQALVFAAWISIFLGRFAKGRPILMLLGEPGVGKTVTQRVILILFYGARGDTSGGVALDRAMKDLAATAVHRSLVARDDFSDMPKGAIDVLNRMSTGGELTVAAFHETLALQRYEMSAQVILSAFLARWFTRQDLMERLLPVEFGRRTGMSTLTESQRMARARTARVAVWAETLTALQAVLREPGIEEPQCVSRFDDWERLVRRVAYVAGRGPAFDSALRKMAAERVRVARRSNPLFDLIGLVADDPTINSRWWSATQLVEVLAKRSGAQKGERDPHVAGAVVRNPRSLAQFLSDLKEQGGVVATVESTPGPGHAALWNIRPVGHPRPPVDAVGTAPSLPVLTWDDGQ